MLCRQALSADKTGADPGEYRERRTFWVPNETCWQHLIYPFRSVNIVAQAMVPKKPEPRISLWSSCCETHDGVGASQHEDRVLVLLVTRYVTDKYVRQFCEPVAIPHRTSFKGVVALRSRSDIGVQIIRREPSPCSRTLTRCSICRTSTTPIGLAAARR